MSTELYRRTMAYDHGDALSNEMMHEIWRDFPWMIDAYMGGSYCDREMAILHWCIEQFGPQILPSGNLGRWHAGSATVDGWTWMGFTTEADMRKFLERWPPPEGVTPR